MRRFKSDAFAVGDAASVGSGAGTQIGNAFLLAVGVAAVGFPSDVFPSFVTIGLQIGGLLLSLTVLADVVADYGGELVSRTLAEINVRYSKHPTDAPEVVRLVPVRSGTPQPASVIAATPRAYQARDLAAFLQHGAAHGFGRRRYLPDAGAGDRFQFPSRRAFGRSDYDSIAATLRGVGLLDGDGRLMVALPAAIAAVMGNPGGQPARAGTGAGMPAGTADAGKGGAS